MRMLSNQSLQCKDLIETRTPQNKTSFQESLNRIKSIERMNSYSSFLNQSYSREILKNVFDENKRSIGINVNLEDFEEFSPTKTRASDSSMDYIHFCKEDIDEREESIKRRSTIKQFFREKIVQGRIKKKISNSMTEKKVEGQGLSLIEFFLQKVVDWD